MYDVIDWKISLLSYSIYFTHKRPVATGWLQNMFYYRFTLTVRQFGVFKLLRIGKHPLNIRPYEYSLGLPGVMSFHLISHLMVAKFFMFERKWNNFYFYFIFLFILLLFHFH